MTITPKRRTNEITREKLKADIAEYIARGGTIRQCDHTANYSYGKPIKAKRKDQLKHLKAFGADRSRE